MAFHIDSRSDVLCRVNVKAAEALDGSIEMYVKSKALTCELNRNDMSTIRSVTYNPSLKDASTYLVLNSGFVILGNDSITLITQENTLFQIDHTYNVVCSGNGRNNAIPTVSHPLTVSSCNTYLLNFVTFSSMSILRSFAFDEDDVVRSFLVDLSMFLQTRSRFDEDVCNDSRFVKNLQHNFVCLTLESLLDIVLIKQNEPIIGSFVLTQKRASNVVNTSQIIHWSLKTDSLVYHIGDTPDYILSDRAYEFEKKISICVGLFAVRQQVAVLSIIISHRIDQGLLKYCIKWEKLVHVPYETGFFEIVNPKLVIEVRLAYITSKSTTVPYWIASRILNTRDIIHVTNGEEIFDSCGEKSLYSAIKSGFDCK